tara:strand:+ start:702 stop:1124 length:423 start_codon:yes stop_codon:yes gene_type:complete
MTKLSIIDIELGIDINSIIQENVEAITGDAKKQLDAAITVAKEKEKIVKNKKLTRQKIDDGIIDTMMEAYAKLETAGDEGCKVSDVLDLVKGKIANGSAFSLRMKKLLRVKDNPYALARRKNVNGARYYFEPYNRMDISE